MTKSNAGSIPAGLAGRQKRKRLPDLHAVEECGSDLLSLHKAIEEQVGALEKLTSVIEEADTDDDQPRSESGFRNNHRLETNNGSSVGTVNEEEADTWLGGSHAAVQRAFSACRDHGEEQAQLRSHLKQERSKRTKQRKKAFEGFSLPDVNQQIRDFVTFDSSSSSSLEFPDFSKMQRMQVRALAAVYGLEARACGRRGQTLFKGSSAGLPTTDGQAQVDRLLACSFQGGKPSHAAKTDMAAALQIGRASLKQPIAATNKGNILLKQMGWSEGFGLGIKEQGRAEPIPLHIGQQRRGLGS